MMCRRALPIASVLFFLLCGPAMAYTPPAAQSILGVISILPVMILLTLLGGGYGALKGYERSRKEAGRGTLLPRSGVLRVGGTLLLILASMSMDVLAVLAAVIFGLLAVGRGVEMVQWGLGALPGRQRPAYLENANPFRLIVAGLTLVPLSLFLLSVPVGFLGHSSFNISRAEADEIVQEMVAYQMADAEMNGLVRDGIALFDQKSDDYAFSRFKRNFHVRLKRSDTGQGFHLRVIPYRFPKFPYNHFVSKPTYLADRSGSIQRMSVHGEEPCHPDAPVVMKVKAEDVQKARAHFNR